MSPSSADAAIADPIGVLCAAIEAVEDALSADEVRGVVEAVAGGRAKRRQLAKAVVERRALLEDGCSPAPRVVGDLLVALRRAGAGGISAPRCAGCSKELRTFQRRGADWYCSVCVSKSIECASCGNRRQLATRDREGRPRCGSCPPDDGADPTEVICAVVATIDPSIAPDVVRAAVAKVTTRTGQRRQLAWALEDRPELLTGAGAASPVPSVLRLIGALVEAGATGIVRPPCPHCGRVRTLSKMREGLRSCRNCEAKAKAVPCSRCGAVRQPATRDAGGRPLCPHCLSTDPANQEVCVSCRRRRPVNVRSPDGPLCQNCRPRKEAACSICGRLARCEISVLTGRPWCNACQQRWARCSRCGKILPLRGGSLDEPLCASCSRPDSSLLRRCPTCGDRLQLRAGPCARCAFEAKVHELLSDDDGEIRRELQGLYANLVSRDRPDTVMSFIDKDGGAVLHDLARGARPLSHTALDELGGAKPVEHLRSVLVATGALPPRDEQMVRLEAWIATVIAARPDHDEQHLLQRYALWHLLRRLRRRGKKAETTHIQATTVKSHVRAAIALLDWLAGRGLTLAAARQGDLEEWLSSDELTHRREVGHFVRWAAGEKLTVLELPAARWGGPSGPIDGEARFAKARSLLTDATIDLGDRVAGLLVLLYAQRAAAISRLSVAHVERSDDGAVRLRLGTVPIVLPSPLDTLVLDLVANRHGHAVLGDQGASPWLFPGGQPGRPISASRLAERLRVLGLPAGPARSTALFSLASELPAVLLSRLLGIHISVAVQWQHASSGDWARYAAEVSARPTR